MNGVLKTVWYFYVGGSGRLVLTLILLSIVLALFGIAAGAITFALLAFLFASPNSFSDDPESRRIFGILPVSRKQVTVGEFLSVGAAVMLGQLPSIGFLWLSSKRLLSHLLPEGLRTFTENFPAECSALSVSILAIAASASCAAFAFLLMKLRIHGEGSVIKWVIILACLLVFASVMLGRDDLPEERFFVITAVIAEIAAVAVSAVCCAITVKKTAKKEF